MNRTIVFSALAAILVGSVAYTSYVTRQNSDTELIYTSLTSETSADEINWMSWDAAVAANKANPKGLFIDVYTDWCVWCKRMDATTFKDPQVVNFVKENYYAVKFDAEQKGQIVYDGKTFVYESNGNRGVHELAKALLENRLSYPAIVYFNGQMERVMISPGYKDPEALLAELQQSKSK